MIIYQVENHKHKYLQNTIRNIKLVQVMMSCKAVKRHVAISFSTNIFKYFCPLR